MRATNALDRALTARWNQQHTCTMSNDPDCISLAKQYVSASNAHDLALIETMLAEDCRYVSSGVGEHQGKQAILAMMDGFFSANPDVHWDVAEFQLKAPRRVGFDFTISLGGKVSQGAEHIDFQEDGKISAIEVLR